MMTHHRLNRARGNRPLQQLLIERDGPVALVRFNNPPQGFMNSATLEDLEAATLEFDSDDAVRAVVYTGSQPDVFIKHYDTSELAGMARHMRKREMSFSPERMLPERNIDIIFNRIGASRKPHIAAINGACMGGGLEFALACDLRYARAGDYRMGQIEIALGILPGAGGVARTAKMIGAARAMELCLLGEAFSPAQAAELGLVNELVQGDVLARAMEVAHRIAGYPPLPVAHIKRIARAAADPADPQALALERTLFMDLMVQDEAVELLDAYNDGTLTFSDRADR